jgi:osmotically-inducible protein OsmY
MSILNPIMTRMGRGALVAAVACGAAACVTAPHRTPAERQADKDMADRVQLALNSDQVLYARHITILADSGAGVVTLGGYVWTPEELNQAKDDARAVSGVTKVIDRMEVDRGAVSDSSVTR